MAYDRAEESLLRRARAYATGSPVQVDYDNEEDLLNQIQSYAQNPRYRNPQSTPPETYDPTAMEDVPYPGNVPQNEFLQSPPQGESPEMMEDLTGQYANEDPIGGAGKELATEPFQPGFMYMGPAEGEAEARANYQAPLGPPDLGGNAYARQAALEFGRRKAQAEAEREIEYAYKEANTARQMKAVQMARDFQRRQEVNRMIQDEGLDPSEAALRAGLWETPRDLAKLTTPPVTSKTMNVRGTVVTIDTKTGQPTSTFTPTQPPATQGPLKAFPVVEEQTGERIPGIAQIQMPNGSIKTFKTSDEQEREMQLTFPIPGASILESGKGSGTPTQWRETFGPTSTNLPPVLRQSETNAAPAAGSAYKTAADVVADYKAKKIDRAAAKKLLADQFGVK